MNSKILVSNEQAFRALASGDKHATTIILGNFAFFVRGRAGFFMSIYDDIQLDFNELVSVGHIGIINAIKLYRGDAIPFAPFVTVVIQNAMLNYVKQMRSPTAKLLLYGLSLDDTLFEDNNTLLISDIVSEEEDDELLGMYNPKAIGFVEDHLPANLIPLELLVIKWKLKGYTYAEIQEMFNIPKRRLDETIALIKRKWFGKK